MWGTIAGGTRLAKSPLRMRRAPEPGRNVSGLIVWSVMFIALTSGPIRGVQPAPGAPPAAVPAPSLPAVDNSTPVTFRYSLDTRNASSWALTSCAGPAGPVMHDVHLTVLDDWARARAMRSGCLRDRR